MGTFKTRVGDLIFSVVCFIIALIFIYIFINCITIKYYPGLLSAVGILIFGYISYLYFKSFIVRKK